MHKINDAEIPIMDYVWESEPVSAANIAAFAAEQLNWKKNTTYTVIKRLCDRGILSRTEDVPMMITSLVSREDAEQAQAQDLLNKMYQGSLKMFLSAFIKRQDISEEKLDKLQSIVDELEE